MEHQGKERLRLGLSRHLRRNQTAKPERLAGERGGFCIARALAVDADGEGGIDPVQNMGQPGRKVLAVGQGRSDPRRLDLGPGAGQPLAQRAGWDQEGPSHAPRVEPEHQL